MAPIEIDGLPKMAPIEIDGLPKMALIEIDGLPINSMVIFHGKMLVHRRVSSIHMGKKISIVFCTRGISIDHTRKHQVWRGLNLQRRNWPPRFCLMVVNNWFVVADGFLRVTNKSASIFFAPWLSDAFISGASRKSVPKLPKNG